MHFRQTAHTKKVVECLDFRIIRLPAQVFVADLASGVSAASWDAKRLIPWHRKPNIICTHTQSATTAYSAGAFQSSGSLSASLIRDYSCAPLLANTKCVNYAELLSAHPAALESWVTLSWSIKWCGTCGSLTNKGRGLQILVYRLTWPSQLVRFVWDN